MTLRLPLQVSRATARSARGVLVVCAITSAGFVAACGGSGGETAASSTRAAATTTAPAAPCGEERADPVAIASAGEELEGAAIGSGSVGIVFAHQFRGNLCDFLPFAKDLAKKDLAALTFTFSARRRLAGDVVAAANELRRRGAKRLILVGASLGGTSVLAAAERIRGVVGVISLSAGLLYEDTRALPGARRLHVPVLFVAARDDDEFPRDARRLFAETPSAKKRLLIIDDFLHGVDLLQDEKARRAVITFVEERAR